MSHFSLGHDGVQTRAEGGAQPREFQQLAGLSGRNSPVGCLKSFNLSEVSVSGYKDHPVMVRRSRDPNIVFGNWSPLLSEQLL